MLVERKQEMHLVPASRTKKCEHDKNIIVVYAKLRFVVRKPISFDAKQMV